MAVDLDNMNRKELESLRKDVDRALSTLADREKKAALAAAEKAAAEHGYSLADLTNASTARSRKSGTKGAPKYRNPADPSQTWTGKGRRPKWIVDAESAGRPLSDFEI
ncbi:H-NS histone family protein [Wenxinia marina]|uniref:DNA-binding protein H-NS n=1 Tax=Wenxinia marina DSM 24838 TaxID=1123501 RepID=A0A0D0PGN8_9RHOB|nr:H-NS histone family protein [Wenxinia marina]KIQ70511.1 DNA-binding protein H-NS [Wenxinia marina DSM 24838]GGL52544.1 nucleoid-structuring protein H-NS [Wenxinia marina]